ncbi:MAG: hypothetical protein ACFFD4_14215 [Candidatus Odinarchaeota archaeon]
MKFDTLLDLLKWLDAGNEQPVDAGYTLENGQKVLMRTAEINDSPGMEQALVDLGEIKKRYPHVIVIVRTIQHPKVENKVLNRRNADHEQVSICFVHCKSRGVFEELLGVIQEFRE